MSCAEQYFGFPWTFSCRFEGKDVKWFLRYKGKLKASGLAHSVPAANASASALRMRISRVEKTINGLQAC